MAQKTHIVLVDDIDGGEATQTVTFAIDGVTYEIDLNDDHAAALRESLAEWTAKARRVGGRRTRRTGGAGTSQTAKIRAWAQANGYEVSARGRIPATVVEAYNDAN